MNVNATAMNKKRTVVVHTRSNNGLFLLPFEILLWVCVVSFNRARINELFERWWFWDLSWFFISWSKLWMNFSVDRILRFFKWFFLFSCSLDKSVSKRIRKNRLNFEIFSLIFQQNFYLSYIFATSNNFPHRIFSLKVKYDFPIVDSFLEGIDIKRISILCREVIEACNQCWICV